MRETPARHIRKNQNSQAYPSDRNMDGLYALHSAISNDNNWVENGLIASVKNKAAMHAMAYLVFLLRKNFLIAVPISQFIQRKYKGEYIICTVLCPAYLQLSG